MYIIIYIIYKKNRWFMFSGIITCGYVTRFSDNCDFIGELRLQKFRCVLSRLRNKKKMNAGFFRYISSFYALSTRLQNESKSTHVCSFNIKCTFYSHNDLRNVSSAIITRAIFDAVGFEFKVLYNEKRKK